MDLNFEDAERNKISKIFFQRFKIICKKISKIEKKKN
jgi:hypothetical protein